MRAGHLPIDEQVAYFRAALSRNRTLTEVLGRAVAMGLPGWYVARSRYAGCGNDRNYLPPACALPPHQRYLIRKGPGSRGRGLSRAG